MKLISMKDYVIEFSNILNSAELRKYAEFLDQPLTLGMFVPCDEDGEVLEVPPRSNDWHYGILENWSDELTDKWNKYEAAKERCIFEVKGDCLEEMKMYCDKDIFETTITLEELVMVDVYPTLTKSAIKQIGI